MPHKHKRDKSKSDASFYNLPPTKAAKSLPVKKTPTSSNTKAPKPSKRKRALDDDTPWAFTRLFTHRPPRSGLDDGTRPSKKHKTTSNPSTTTNTTTNTQPPAPTNTSIAPPKILPNEPLSSFAARVDAALPFSSLSKKSGAGGKEGSKTKTERKMQRMYKEWRTEEQRRREKRQEDDDEKEGDVDEGGVNDMLSVTQNQKKKGKKSGKRKRVDDSEDDDPWAGIKAKKIEGVGEVKGGRGGGLVGLHDVVQAPPKFTRVPKARGDVNIGKVGGLKRQVELSEARRSVVEGYRAMMREKRG